MIPVSPALHTNFTDLQIKYRYTDMNSNKSRNQNIIYKDLSYKIIGINYDVYNELGYGYQEKFYQKAIALKLDENKIKYAREIYVPLIFDDKKIGAYFLDFLIDDKIVLEIKKGDRISRKDIEQVYAYLKAKNLMLGIIIRFTSSGIKIKRIVNLK